MTSNLYYSVLITMISGAKHSIVRGDALDVPLRRVDGGKLHSSLQDEQGNLLLGGAQWTVRWLAGLSQPGTVPSVQSPIVEIRVGQTRTVFLNLAHIESMEIRANYED